ncbi:hypothetical protein [Micromonospora sp. 15K316]|uniref:hypothetical protein n=1 Tax=Micromonospora sp. 15K316 TaxID=2530376 RepID=UPI0014055F00|nr:hypothetical protein [Micromonospora sp. 15K316]
MAHFLLMAGIIYLAVGVEVVLAYMLTTHYSIPLGPRWTGLRPQLCSPARPSFSLVGLALVYYERISWQPTAAAR